MKIERLFLSSQGYLSHHDWGVKWMWKSKMAKEQRKESNADKINIINLEA